MGGFVILLIFAAIGIFISRAAKINQQKTEGKAFGENFPFPSVFDLEEEKPFDHWNMTLSNDLAHVAPSADEMVVDEVKPTTYRSIDMSDRSTEPIEAPKEKDRIDFDLRQAVIYSEILKPKFMEQ